MDSVARHRALRWFNAAFTHFMSDTDVVRIVSST
jgi:hypothetical protein